MRCKVCNKKLINKQRKYCSRKCQNQCTNLKHQNYESQQKRGLERKIYFIKKLGSKCSNCGYDKNYAALQFHHLDPKIKERGLDLRKLSNSNIKKILLEIDKCILLCSNCHFEVHNPRFQKELLENFTKNIEQEQAEKKKLRELKNHCLVCNKVISTKSAKFCRECSHSSKIEWPSKEELKNLVWIYPMSVLSKDLKVSDRSIAKRCKKFNIEIPPRGFWIKKHL